EENSSRKLYALAVCGGPALDGCLIGAAQREFGGRAYPARCGHHGDIGGLNPEMARQRGKAPAELVAADLASHLRHVAGNVFGQAGKKRLVIVRIEGGERPGDQVSGLLLAHGSSSRRWAKYSSGSLSSFSRALTRP